MRAFLSSGAATPALVALSALVPFAVLRDTPEARHKAAVATIEEDQIDAHVRYLASPKLEGRNTPSGGLDLAAEYIAGVFAEAGLLAAPDSLEAWERNARGLKMRDWATPPEGEGTYLRPYPFNAGGRRSALTRPVPEDCALEVAGSEDGAEAQQFEYGKHFVPVAECGGDVRGELVFAGFGISSKSMKYNDFKGLDLKRKIAVVLEGEPRHRKKFKGPEVTAEASYWNKLDKIRGEGVAGVIFVRREPAKPRKSKVAPEPAPLSYRYGTATWNPPSTDRRRGGGPPAIEVTPDVASRLLGEDVRELAARIDKSARPYKLKKPGRMVSFRSTTVEGGVAAMNVIGVVPGSDLADEYVVLGAHYDHIGVGPRGRIGLGADDNGSGSSALLEIVEAMSIAKPRRSILFCSFSGEEKGLLGSKAIAEDLPVPKGRVVAMVNLDMVGVGDPKEVTLLGIQQNPGFDKLVKRANRLSKTGIRKLTEINDRGLFQRSDHYSFHQAGIPALFLMEGYPPEKNRDYHSYRDTPDTIDMRKVTSTARLAFNVVWLLAQDDERPPAPRK
ncbi:MAG: M28 family peptidase [bacterium]|nr:M28 family peptidase [bacterium]